MKVTITPTLLSGTIRPPSSKSQGHRLMIAAALAQGNSWISHINNSQDITATLQCMQALGADFHWEDDTTLSITGISAQKKREPVLNCGESGSTLRFFMPIALALQNGGTFLGQGRLMERPQEPYFEIFREQGISYQRGDNTLSLSGSLCPGQFRLRGDVSSQFITGLLYALPLLNGDSEIVLTTPLESAGYVDMTIEVLQQFGIVVAKTRQGWLVPGNQSFSPQSCSVEADYSQAGFFYAMAGLGNQLTIAGMKENSTQGDRMVVPYMAQLDAPGTVTLDVGQCPDLVPPLAARAALRAGSVTHIVNAGRLRIKESDRLSSVTALLTALGADIEEHPDSLTIHGKSQLAGGVTVDSWNDHRIAMMASVAATRCQHPITITGAECVRKSYPEFWQDYRRLGGMLQEETP